MKKIVFIILNLLSIQTMAQLKFIPSGAYHWSEAPVRKSDDREGRRFAEGTSPQFEYLEIHASTQQKRAVPRPPHAQKDIEELIIVKEGTMKFTINNQSRVLLLRSVSAENTKRGFAANVSRSGLCAQLFRRNRTFL